MATDADAIIVGAGHNGLVAAGYLAQAGLKVLVLERREVVGGAAVTEEFHPGYRISTCSYFCHILQKKVIDDLELRRYGFEVYSTDPVWIQPFEKGRFLRVWQDDAKTAAAVGQVSKADGEAWPKWKEFRKRAAGLLSQFYLSPAPSLAELMEKAREQGEEELLETLLVTPLKELVERYFESEEAKALTFGLQADLCDISAPGSAYALAFLWYSDYREDMENFGLVKGGMGGVTQAMARSAEARGAERGWSWREVRS